MKWNRPQLGLGGWGGLPPQSYLPKSYGNTSPILFPVKPFAMCHALVYGTRTDLHNLL